jgi:hypothetical protein
MEKETRPMRQVLRERATVQPGGGIELHHPALRAGDEVDVIVVIGAPDDASASPAPLSSYLSVDKGDRVMELAERFVVQGKS